MPVRVKRVLPAITEKAFMAQVIQLAQLFRWKVYHTHDSRRSEKGFPDLVLVRERILFVELKTDKGKLTKEQMEWLHVIELAGGSGHIWRPIYWADIERALR